MAMFDYGALLRVNGKFVNKNMGLFMDASDTGCVCEKAINKKGVEENIYGDYFVYAGDENFLVVFYKGCCKAISKGKIILSEYGMPFNSETYFMDNLPTLKISRLSPKYEYKKIESCRTWEDYVRENWFNATGKEKLSELKDGRTWFKLFRKNKKRSARYKGYKNRPFRFLAEWEHNGNKYEVIFGYGIDPSEKTWNKIKYEYYGFREDERKLIDSWFEEKMEDKKDERTGNVTEN